jgi:hypothetical protein
MLDLTSASPSVHRLVEWLLNEVFRLEREQIGGTNNQFARFRRSPLVVDVTADRGDWSIGIGLESMSATYHPDEWEAWQDNFDLADDLSDLDHQIDFVTTRWPDIAANAGHSADAEAQIRAIGVDFVRRRFGEWSAER